MTHLINFLVQHFEELNLRISPTLPRKNAQTLSLLTCHIKIILFMEVLYTSLLPTVKCMKYTAFTIALKLEQMDGFGKCCQY